MPRVCSLVSWSVVTRRFWGWNLDSQHLVFLLEFPRFLEQGLYLPFAFLLSSFHALMLVKITFITHSWWTTSWGCGHLRKGESRVPTDGANVEVATHRDICVSLTLVLDQLRVMLPSLFLQKMSGQVVWTHPPKLLLLWQFSLLFPFRNQSEVCLTSSLRWVPSRVLYSLEFLFSHLG